MSEWTPISEWHQCVELAKPGIIFEIRNAEGQSLFTGCTSAFSTPFDWKSPPIVFRAIPAPKPVHSEPMPEPRR